MGVLRPKCSSEDDELSFKNIEKHVRPSTHFDEWTDKEYGQKHIRKVASPLVEFA